MRFSLLQEIYISFKNAALHVRLTLRSTVLLFTESLSVTYSFNPSINVLYGRVTRRLDTARTDQV